MYRSAAQRMSSCLSAVCFIIAATGTVLGALPAWDARDAGHDAADVLNYSPADAIVFSSDGGAAGAPDTFSGCGQFQHGPQGCPIFVADAGVSFFVAGLPDISYFTPVKVTGTQAYEQFCPPLGDVIGLKDVVVSECPPLYSGCGEFQHGPQSCTTFVGDDGQSFFVEDTGGFGLFTHVYVKGYSVLGEFCPPFGPVAGLVDLQVEECESDFAGCGKVGIAFECGLIFFTDSGESFLIDNIGDFDVGDTLFAMGTVVKSCQPPFFLCGNVSCLVDTVVSPCKGDMNGDGAIDFDDRTPFRECFTGAGGTFKPGCEAGDFDGDGDIDADDLAAFRALLVP